MVVPVFYAQGRVGKITGKITAKAVCARAQRVG